MIDDLLYDLGLERRHALASTMSTLAVFAVGVLAGAAIGLAVAPRSGKELREDIAQRVSELREQMGEKFQSAAKRGERYYPPS